MRVVLLYFDDLSDAQFDVADGHVESLSMVDGVFVFLGSNAPGTPQDFKGIDFSFYESFFDYCWLLIFNGDEGELSVEMVFFFHKFVHLFYE